MSTGRHLGLVVCSVRLTLLNSNMAKLGVGHSGRCGEAVGAGCNGAGGRGGRDGSWVQRGAAGAQLVVGAVGQWVYGGVTDLQTQISHDASAPPPAAVLPACDFFPHCLFTNQLRKPVNSKRPMSPAH